VLAVKNGLPHLRKTIEAVQRQTYRRFELIVQDGGSTDGSLEFLQSIRDLPKLKVASEPDGGIGQAFNRGISRSSGDIVAFVSCDEFFDDDALEKAVGWFMRQPEAAAIYGSVRLIDTDDRIVQVFVPSAFELNGVLHNEIVPPIAAAFLNRARIGDNLYYDETLKTCPDYDFWIRVGRTCSPGAIVQIQDPIVVARADRASMSYRAESFDQFCKDKLLILERYLGGSENRSRDSDLRKTAAAGILTWAAENVFSLEGASPAFFRWCEQAAALYPNSDRLRRLGRRTLAFEIDTESGRLLPNPSPQPSDPPAQAWAAQELVHLEQISVLPHWHGASVEKTDALRVKTGEQPWSYAAQIPLHLGQRMRRDWWYWVRLDVKAVSGQVGLSAMVDDQLSDEHFIGPEEGRRHLFVRIGASSTSAVIIRNASLPGSSVVDIFDARVDCCQRAGANGDYQGSAVS
jgi:glycosyltransferase